MRSQEGASASGVVGARCLLLPLGPPSSFCRVHTSAGGEVPGAHTWWGVGTVRFRGTHRQGLVAVDEPPRSLGTGSPSRNGQGVTRWQSASVWRPYGSPALSGFRP